MSEGIRGTVRSGFGRLRPRVRVRGTRFGWVAGRGRVPGVGFGPGKLAPGLAEHSEYAFNFNQRLFGLLEISFAETICHVFIETTELQAHLRGGMVVEGRAKLHQDRCRPRDRFRSLRDSAIF